MKNEIVAAEFRLLFCFVITFIRVLDNFNTLVAKLKLNNSSIDT